MKSSTALGVKIRPKLSNLYKFPHPPSNTQDILAASAFSKAVASTVTYPHEVVRSHMHVMGSGPLEGFVPTCKQIWREEGGIRGFYKGCGMNLLRTMPAAAITFTSFELILRSIKHYAEKETAKGVVDL